MAIDTLIPQLVINKMTQSQYDEALENGAIVGTELYFIPSDGSDVGGGGAVASVNGQIGEVNLTAEDVGAIPVITGTQGQVVGFDAEGNAVAQEAPESVLCASYNETSYDEINEAYQSGKAIHCIYEEHTLYLDAKDETARNDKFNPDFDIICYRFSNDAWNAWCINENGATVWVKAGKDDKQSGLTNLVDGTTEGSVRGTYVVDGETRPLEGRYSFSSSRGDALGEYSFAANTSQANGSSSFAANDGYANGSDSFAINDATASATDSFASGYKTVAYNENMSAFGSYNIEGVHVVENYDANKVITKTYPCTICLSHSPEYFSDEFFKFKNQINIVIESAEDLDKMNNDYSYWPFGISFTSSGDESFTTLYRTGMSSFVPVDDTSFQIKYFTEYTIVNDDPDTIFVVGNGDGDSSRSNAYTLDKSGNAWFAGDVYVGSTSGTNKDEGSKKLATVDDYKNAILLDGESLKNTSGEDITEDVKAIVTPTEMTGSTSSTAGTSGLVPAPSAGDEGKFLKGDGTWGDAGLEEFVVTFTFGDVVDEYGGYKSYETTCDRTFDEVRTALDAGKRCVGKIIWETSIIDIHLIQNSSSAITFGTINYTTGVAAHFCTLYSRGNVYGDSMFLEQMGSGHDAIPVTLYTSSWTEQSDGSYAQSVSVTGVTADNTNVIDCRQTGSDKDANIAILQGWGCVNDCKQSAGTLTFYCYGDAPTVNIPISVVVM